MGKSIGWLIRGYVPSPEEQRIKHIEKYIIAMNMEHHCKSDAHLEPFTGMYWFDQNCI